MLFITTLTLYRKRRFIYLSELQLNWYNTAIGLMRWAGEINIAAACRKFAAKPEKAMEIIGAMEN